MLRLAIARGARASEQGLQRSARAQWHQQRLRQPLVVRPAKELTRSCLRILTLPASSAPMPTREPPTRPSSPAPRATRPTTSPNRLLPRLPPATSRPSAFPRFRLHPPRPPQQSSRTRRPPTSLPPVLRRTSRPLTATCLPPATAAQPPARLESPNLSAASAASS